MTTAIMGAGAMAAGLARRLAEFGEAVTIGARDPDKGASLAAAIGFGVESLGVHEAAASAEAIILAVPYAAVEDVLSSAGDLGGKVLIDISNPVTPDFLRLTLGFSTSAAEEIQRLAPGAYVAKAFNTIFAGLLAKPTSATADLQVFYATDHRAAGEVTEKLIRLMGFLPVFAGPLTNARYLEPLGELNIHFGFALGHGIDTAPAWVKL